jgi:hypothetical protein
VRQVSSFHFTARKETHDTATTNTSLFIPRNSPTLPSSFIYPTPTLPNFSSVIMKTAQPQIKDRQWRKAVLCFLLEFSRQKEHIQKCRQNLIRKASLYPCTQHKKGARQKPRPRQYSLY